ncbi:hypothetical protein EYZ11_007935 [Aspergillus tanneri]|uniref:Uncharacterized protein n=1 Tax=Aspergillus tanneri TaxID=1220188 RepID=A0A4S3JC59_9EURO|nr:hypothetical protein EYZ11_007935 [Aspergillus tanneri]
MDRCRCGYESATKIEVGLVSPRESDWVQWWDEPQQDQFGDEAAGVMAIDLPGGQVKEWDYNLVNQRGTDSAVQQAGWMSIIYIELPPQYQRLEESDSRYPTVEQPNDAKKLGSDMESQWSSVRSESSCTTPDLEWP